MATTVGIFQQSGGGKTTSIVVNPDGKCVYLNEGHPNKAEKYEGMDPESTVIIASDKKRLPFPMGKEWVEKKNVFTTSNSAEISKLLKQIGAGKKIKSVVIDTINGIMIDKEMLESQKLTYDKWMDLAKEIYQLITLANSLRDDLIIYFTGHVTVYTDVDGNESKCLITNGRKLEKIKLESKLPIVLFGSVERDMDGTNQYWFETQANRSTAKSPMGMFKDLKIPNSLKLVDKTIRDYFSLN